MSNAGEERLLEGYGPEQPQSPGGCGEDEMGAPTSVPNRGPRVLPLRLSCPLGGGGLGAGSNVSSLLL